jgi:hypothetical protein
VNFAGIELFKLRVYETTCSDIKRLRYASFVLAKIGGSCLFPVKTLVAAMGVG